MSSIGARHSPRISALCAVLALHGCAGLSEVDCRGANWYAVGYRDARYKLQSQAEIYALQCARHGVQVDAASYEQGLRQGRFDFPDRMT
jgi:hypothetical protein